MSDDKLLELSAKAAGYHVRHLRGALGYFMSIDGFSRWNPISDDGDAFRLSVKLGLFVDNEQERCGAVTVSWGCDAGGSHSGSIEEDAPEGGDDYAAARRAIVRAAAEIGKLMP